MEIRRIASFLEIAVTDELVARTVTHSGFAAMKKQSNNFRFFRKGALGFICILCPGGEVYGRKRGCFWLLFLGFGWRLASSDVWASLLELLQDACGALSRNHVHRANGAIMREPPITPLPRGVGAGGGGGDGWRQQGTRGVGRGGGRQKGTRGDGTGRRAAEGDGVFICSTVLSFQPPSPYIARCLVLEGVHCDRTNLQRCPSGPRPVETR